MTAPIRHMALPSLPSIPSSSLRKYDPNTAPINTLNAPNGVTNIAGANAYAAKLQTSPTTTVFRGVSFHCLPYDCGPALRRFSYALLFLPTILDFAYMCTRLLQSHVVLLRVVIPRIGVESVLVEVSVLGTVAASVLELPIRGRRTFFVMAKLVPMIQHVSKLSRFRAELFRAHTNS